MRSFTEMDRVIGQVPGVVATTLSTVDVGRGSEALHRNQLPDLLNQLADRARVASITASSAIEGIVVLDAGRADRILTGRAKTLRTRSEQELAGYRDAQDYLFQDTWRPLNVGLLLHLHKLLFSHTATRGGNFKTEDNLVVDRAPTGELTTRFRPVPAKDTEFYVAELIDRYQVEVAAQRHHPVLLVSLFALDLLVIHPFIDGNGRVARVLTNALLMDAGYNVSRYVSLEQAIAESADQYYQSLLDSTHGWHDQQANPWPWLAYFVQILADAYRTFTQRTAADRKDGSKQERVEGYVSNHAPPVFRMNDARTALPGISDQTIRLVLDRMRRDGAISITGLGRSASWRRAA